MNKQPNPNIIVIILIAIILYFFSGCSSDEISTSTSNEMFLYDNFQPEAMTVNFSVSQGDSKIIRHANIDFSTYEFDSAIDDVNNLVASYSGFFEDSSTINEETGRSFLATIRVPYENYSLIKTAIEDIGTLIFSSDFVEDKGEEYSDTSAKLNAKYSEEARLLELLGNAVELDDIISIEERLSLVRADIEIYNYHLFNIDNLVDYSTINISIMEIPTTTLSLSSNNFGSRIKNGFVQSFNNTSAFFQELTLIFASLIVPFVGIMLIVFIIKFSKKALKKR